MKIKQLELFNFGQFYGSQVIEFSGADKSAQQMITVIYEKNGSGKVDLYRAMLFCLYGEKALRRLPKYGKDENNIQLVNGVALGEDASGAREGVKAHVRVMFSHHDRDYEMYRALSGIRRDDGKIIEQIEDLKLTITNKAGKTQVWGLAKKDAIDREIGHILDWRLKRFFTFDGRKIARLAKVSQGKSILEEIKYLLNIDEVYSVEEAMRKLDKKLSDEISKVVNGDFRSRIDLRRKCQGQIEELSRKRLAVETEIVNACDERDEVDKELEKYKHIASLVNERKNREAEQQQLFKQKDEAAEKLRHFLPDAILLLARDSLAEVYQDIDEGREKGWIPFEIKRELVEKLLLEMSCICGRPLMANSLESEHLRQWYESSGAALNRAAMEFFRSIGNTTRFSNGKTEELDRLLKSVNSSVEAHSLGAVQLEKLVVELENTANMDVFQSYCEKRLKLSEKIAALEKEQKHFSRELNSAEAKLKKLELEVDNFNKESAMNEVLQKKHSVVIKTHDLVKKIIAKYVEDAGRVLEQETNTNFVNLFELAGQKKSFKKVVLKEDYTLEVLNDKEQPSFLDMSVGQRQVTVLSFFIALVQAASGSHTLDVPLFMDSPFGQLSNEHIERLLNYVPEIAPQLIISVTDKEFGADKGSMLYRTGRWGNFYALEAVTEGATTIKQLPAELYG
ncbi:MAG: hypothetical protein H6Q73_1249 [Firmicutes bacterium]|nr:hypothetical protein [Bacillota bacterium]